MKPTKDNSTTQSPDPVPLPAQWLTFPGVELLKEIKPVGKSWGGNYTAHQICDREELPSWHTSGDCKEENQGVHEQSLWKII